MEKIIKLQDSAIVKVAVIKREKNLLLALDDLDLDFENVLIKYSKVDNSLTFIDYKEPEKSNLLSVRLVAKEDPQRFFFLVRDVFPKGNEMLWQSGICQPTKDEVERLSLKEDACVFEAFMKVPKNYDYAGLSDQITDRDEKRILVSTRVQLIDFDML